MTEIINNELSNNKVDYKKISFDIANLDDAFKSREAKSDAIVSNTAIEYQHLAQTNFDIAKITEAWNLQEWSESNLAWLCWKLDDIFSTCTNWYFNNKSIA